MRNLHASCGLLKQIWRLPVPNFELPVHSRVIRGVPITNLDASCELVERILGFLQDIPEHPVECLS